MAVTTSPGAGRVFIATGAGPLVAEPTWTRYDNITNCKCYGYDSFAGRQSELDTTDTGTATVYFYDTAGVLDNNDLIGCQILLQLYDPVAAAWHIRWRGHVDDIQHSLVDNPGGMLSNVQLTAVGIFDYLGGVKMLPDVFGFPAPTQGHDVVFYEDAEVDDRVISLLTDANISSSMRVVFSGNVWVNETLYDPDDVVLQALRDAVDAEWPGIANVYEDRYGRVVFHGRFARFDPEGTEASASNWDFVRWNAGTREDVTSGVAQVREFAYNRPRSRIINSYLAWPKEDENGVAYNRDNFNDLLFVDTGSRDTYGYRGMEAPDLIIQKHKTNGNTGAEECMVFGAFYIANYSEPRKAIQNCVFKSVWPPDARAAATWDLMCRMDISDVIELTIDEAGLADEPFFVDGVSVECRVANTGHDLVVVTPNLTPGSYYGDPEP